jgi:hypothetical protein
VIQGVFGKRVCRQRFGPLIKVIVDSGLDREKAKKSPKQHHHDEKSNDFGKKAIVRCLSLGSWHAQKGHSVRTCPMCIDLIDSILCVQRSWYKHSALFSALPNLLKMPIV